MKIKLIDYVKLLINKTNKNINEIKDYIDEINDGRNEIILKDKITDFNYQLTIEDGQLKTIAIPKMIILTQANKINYMEGDNIDITGLSFTLEYIDGTSEVYNDLSGIDFEPKRATKDMKFITIIIDGIKFRYNISTEAFDPYIALIDFNFVDNKNGTYSIVSWRGTLNGEPSDIMIIPNNEAIII